MEYAKLLLREMLILLRPAIKSAHKGKNAVLALLTKSIAYATDFDGPSIGCTEALNESSLP
jgi:hypothetical protein